MHRRPRVRILRNSISTETTHLEGTMMQLEGIVAAYIDIAVVYHLPN